MGYEYVEEPVVGAKIKVIGVGGGGEGIGSDVNTYNIKRRKRRIKGFDQ